MPGQAAVPGQTAVPGQAAVPGESAVPAGRHRSDRPVRRFFLGRHDDPRWARPALWAILALATVLYGWKLSAGGTANSYYSAAVLSGTHSWKALFFGALDGGSFITVDKPPMALWVMALTARVIGFGTWSILLPQVVMGVAAVAALYAAVRRSFGHAAGLIAALVLTLTPITVAINRFNNPDTLLVLLLVLAGWACLAAMRTGRLWPLLASAFLVGCAFNTKMLQAFLVLPAFAIGYLLFAKGGFLRRFGHLCAAGAVLVVSSGWWMVVVDAIPAADRPYIGGSGDNTVWGLVTGYNGLGRILGGNGSGGGGGANFGGAAGIGRLFNGVMGGQIAWLIPFAFIALVAALLWYGRGARTARTARTRERWGALVLWGGWLIVHYLVFSLSEGGFHPYYVTAMAPAIAALTGAGAVAMFQAYRRGAAAWPWVLPAALAVTGAVAFVLLRRAPSWHPWVAWSAAALTVAAVLALVVARPAERARARFAAGVGAVAIAAGLAAGLTGPAAYALSAAGTTYGGSNPTAGPSTGDGGGMGGPSGGGARMGGPPGAGRTGGPPSGTGTGGPPGDAQGGPGGSGGGAPTGGFGGGGPGSGGFGGGEDGADTQLVSYLVKHQGGATWLVATSNAQSAASIILGTGKPVIAMGGFTGSDNAMTLAKLKRLAASGKLRYIMVGGDDRGGGADSGITSWVKKNWTLVSPSAYGGSTSSTQQGGGQQLYRYGG